MKFVVIADLIIMFFCALTCLLAVIFLLMALIYRRQCFNFPTLLACNTCVATLFFAANNLAITVHMFVWDQQTVVIADPLCPIRAYLHYSSTAALYYSYILQALQRYCKIKGIHIFNTHVRKLLLVVVQWIVALAFDLPILLTGYLNKLLSDNMCFLPVYEAALQMYTALTMFGIPNILVTILYRRLVTHVRTASTSTTLGNSQRQINRDLIVVRRITILVTLIIFCGTPFCIFLIIGWIDMRHLPPYYLHVAFISMSAISPFILIFLLWITPDLRQCLVRSIEKVRPQHIVTVSLSNRVVPMAHT